MLAAAVVSFGAAVCLVEDLGPGAIQLRLLAAASLGLPLFTALTLYAERRAWDGGRRAALFAVGAAALAGVFLLWPSWTETMQALRYAQLSVAFHLLVALLPVPRGAPRGAFWQYNRSLFLRFLGAALSSGVLYLGLVLALAAIHTLFDVEIVETGWARLWFFIAFVFNTWFFLGGVPDPRAPGEAEYPAALKIFAQFTLVPLVSIYLVILTLYLGRVVVTWDWPSGWIGWLVSGVAAAGILALLLVHPLAERDDQAWIRVFARDFWIAVLPAVIMLWLAIYQRVHQYGITEPRYFLVALSVWLAAMAVYYTVTRSRDIRIIPFTLCLVALVTFAGPWGAYAVSGRDQAGRLRRLLAAREPGQTPFTRSREVSAVVRYLLEVHGDRPILALLPDSARARIHDMGAGESRVAATVRALGLEYVEPWRRSAARPSEFSYSAVDRPVIPVAGFDVLLRLADHADSAAADTVLAAVVNRERAAVEIRRGAAVLLVVPLDTVLRALPDPAAPRRFGQRVPAARMTAARDSGGVRAVVYLESISGNAATGTRLLTGASGAALVRLRR